MALLAFWCVPSTSCPVTAHHWEGFGFLFTPSHQVFINIDKIFPSLLFSRLNTHRSLRLSLYKRCSSPFCGPSLESLWQVHVFLLLVSPRLHTQVDSPVLRHYLPQPAGSTPPNATQDGVAGPLCCKGTLLAHILLHVHHDPQILLCQAAFQPQHGLVHRVVPPQVQDSAFPFVELQEVPFCWFLQPFVVSVNGSTPSCCINHSFQFRIFWKLPEAALCHIVDHYVKQYWPRNQPLGYTNSYWHPVGLCATDHTSRLGHSASFQFFSLPASLAHVWLACEDESYMHMQILLCCSSFFLFFPHSSSSTLERMLLQSHIYFNAPAIPRVGADVCVWVEESAPWPV